MLPMADWLRPWIEAAEGHIVQYRGKPVKKIAGAFQSAREAAGFGPDVTAYTIRHTIATELMARGVPELEIATLLGHRMPNIRTTGRYIHVAPARLASAKAGLDDIANDISRAATRPMLPTLRATCVAVPKLSVPITGAKLLKYRAGKGTGIQHSLGAERLAEGQIRKLKWPRFGGQRTICVRGVHDVEEQRDLSG